MNYYCVFHLTGQAKFGFLFIVFILIFLSSSYILKHYTKLHLFIVKINGEYLDKDYSYK